MEFWAGNDYIIYGGGDSLAIAGRYLRMLNSNAN